ncbi:ABC-type nitrate/sulfonate/bicarbonate transport system ATPase subunit [Bacillus ectoiniformans]|uniref:ABC transporter ATP-binding protein n=1 Tax=Bacillus ectoiniformans TaxID=1494429 RepID=UPI00195888A5|nr:ABC transporter ATP-binding protein [Bacillus ectoiniformans]MBM7649837.1 ABC-type nitrate/sulfonate/bicarbonate transport system ATPase subunit [Bacillus ectoiniformans]
MKGLLIDRLSKSYGDIEVLNNISMKVQPGEFVAILGPSGSGKSTLFHLVGGLIDPDQGKVILDGYDITGLRGNISYMPQQASLFPWRTVLQNMLIGQELAGKNNQDQARQMLKTAGLEGFEDKYPYELSGGMQQRVSFIRALLSPQSLLCLDEPFSALDELTRVDMQKWLINVWETHQKTILFVTHNIDEALFLADRIIVLSNRPGEVKLDFKVPFQRPRTEKLIVDKHFFECKKQLFEQLQNND